MKASKRGECGLIDFFYKLKFRVGCNKICSGWNHLLRYIFNMLYPIYCAVTKPEDGLNHELRKEQVILSLTSFPVRLHLVHYCIRSLLQQTYKPDRIILWLTKEECKNVMLPKELEELKQYGLEINYSEVNLKPHNKLYHTMKRYPDAVIVTVDDDCIYESKLIERLVKAYKSHPNCVCCNMAHEITLKGGAPDLYRNWNGGAVGKSGISNYFVALGVCGVLYPANCFDNEYFDVSLIKDLALSADDLWLKATELRLGISVYKIAPHCKTPYTIGGSQKVALGRINNGQKRNDVVMKKLCEHYGFEWGKLRA